jgi:Tol biopolymer transport system component
MRFVRGRRVSCCLVAALFVRAASAQYAVTQRVSLGPGGVEADENSHAGKLSPDGRFVTFTSYASNLLPVPGYRAQVFLLDRATGRLELVTQSTSGVVANHDSYPWSVSADGRYVAFNSLANNLVASDTNGQGDSFVRDRVLGTTTRVSLDASGAQLNGPTGQPFIADDGSAIAFQSWANNLVPGDTNGQSDVFVKDLVSGQVQRINFTPAGGEANGYALWVSASSDVRWVAYLDTATNLALGDTNGVADVFVTDTLTGSTQRISVSSSGAQSNGASDRPVIARDGTAVVFSSLASNLVAGDTNAAEDVFVHELATGLTERVSLRDNGLQIASTSYLPQISGDGRFAAYVSFGANVIPGDDNQNGDVFVFDRVARRVTCASLGWQGGFVQHGGLGNWPYVSSVSGDGRYVLFESQGAGVVQNDFNHAGDVFLRDWLASTGPVVFCTASTTSSGCTPQISASANPSATLATACHLTVSQVDAQRSGLFFYGIDNSGFAAHPWLGGPSWICVRPPYQRTPLQDSGGSAGACDGSYQLDWNLFQLANASSLGNPWMLGQRIYVQAWFRDPASTATTALSNALELTAQP